MPNITYNISLKDYVGGLDFDRSKVDKEIAKNEDKEVTVLIDYLGGSLATGLSIYPAFCNHGEVAMHFVELNASAAIIASLYSAHISIDRVGKYLDIPLTGYFCPLGIRHFIKILYLCGRKGYDRTTTFWKIRSVMLIL